jgi:TPR repeat protein
MLRPLIEEGHPAALFLFAHFSVSGTETDAEFDARRLGILKRLTDLRYAPAMYELGICYEIGDLVQQDPITAASLYERAAELGSSKAKLSHGLNLFYGSNGIGKNVALGLAFIRQAADENVEGAEARWEELKAL